MFLVTTATVSLLLCACGGDKYEISGNADNESGKVYLLDAKRVAIDSVEIVDGVYSFAGDFISPMRCYLSDNADISSADMALMLFIEEGKISVEKDDNGWYATGTTSNDAYITLIKELSALENEYESETTTDERREEIDAEYDGKVRDAVDNNCGNIFGLYELSSLSYDLDGQEMMDYLAKFSEEMQATETWLSLEKSAQDKLKVAVGKPYIDFAQNNPDGQEVSLKSVIEKEGNRYVLLDFWASWCNPCMGEVPYLLEDYAKYHDKGFEIFGSSLDRSGERWIGAIEDNRMNWVHVSDLKYWDNSGAARYAVRSIPSNFLIDCQTGTIIATNLRGNALGEKLAELLDL